MPKGIVVWGMIGCVGVGARAWARPPAPMGGPDEALVRGLATVVGEGRPQLAWPLRQAMATAIVREARAQGIEPALLTGVAWVESRFDPDATSPKGARGLLQLMPATARSLAGEGGDEGIACRRAACVDRNVELGARYLAELLRRFDRLEHALDAYNRGPTATRRRLASGAGQRAPRYPQAVLAARERFAARLRNSSPPEEHPAEATPRAAVAARLRTDSAANSAVFASGADRGRPEARAALARDPSCPQAICRPGARDGRRRRTKRRPWRWSRDC